VTNREITREKYVISVVIRIRFLPVFKVQRILGNSIKISNLVLACESTKLDGTSVFANFAPMT